MSNRRVLPVVDELSSVIISLGNVKMSKRYHIIARSCCFILVQEANCGNLSAHLSPI